MTAPTTSSPAAPPSTRRRVRRTGVACAELAVCLPVLVLLVLLTIESTSMIFVDQSLTVAAYEGARVASAKTATNAMVHARCNSLLDGRQVNGYTVSLDPADVASVLPGDRIAVNVSAPFAGNSICPDWFFGSKVLQAEVTMVKE